MSSNKNTNITGFGLDVVSKSPGQTIRNYSEEFSKVVIVLLALKSEGLLKYKYIIYGARR